MQVISLRNVTSRCTLQDCEAEIRAMLPDGNFSLMVTVLKKFLRFMDLTASVCCWMSFPI